MYLKTFPLFMAGISAVYGQASSLVCTTVPSICTNDIFNADLDSTFGFILPPAVTGAAVENDIIAKAIISLPYGSAGFFNEANVGVSIIILWFEIQSAIIPGTSILTSTVHGQLSFLTRIPQSLGAIFRPATSADGASCRVQMSPFYVQGKAEVTAYARLRNCSILGTDVPTTVGVFKTLDPANFIDPGNLSADFVDDNNSQTSMLQVANLNNFRVTLEEYNASLTNLSLPLN